MKLITTIFVLASLLIVSVLFWVQATEHENDKLRGQNHEVNVELAELRAGQLNMAKMLAEQMDLTVRVTGERNHWVHERNQYFELYNGCVQHTLNRWR
jgi:hypothetical protein